MARDLMTMIGASWTTIIEIGLAIWLFLRKLSGRDRFWGRVALTCCLWLAGSAFAAWLGFSQDSPFAGDYTAPVEFATFSLVLALSVVAVLFCYDVSVWTAAFCCTAGYTIQNLASGTDGFVRLVFRAAGAPVAETSVTSMLIWYGSFIAVFLVCNYAFVPRIEKGRLQIVEDRGMGIMVAVVVLAVIGFDVVVKSLTRLNTPVGYDLALRAVHGAVCVFVLTMEYELLYRRHLEQEGATTRQMLVDQKRQYELSRSNVEAIDARCHEIRRQIRQLSSDATEVDQALLDDIANEVSVYDSSVKTGNDALDLILTEKSLLCAREHITLTCIADGQALSFVDDADLYALFGSATDGAISQVRRIADKERRSIDLIVRSTGAMVSVHIENYVPSGTDGIAEKDDDLATGTDSGSSSGSIREIVARYGGTLSSKTIGGVSHLNILLPCPAGVQRP